MPRAKAKRVRRKSTCGATNPGNSIGVNATSTRKAPCARRRPRAVEAQAKIRLSLRSSRDKRRRSAPSATRTASSRRRDSERPTWRLPTLAHAMIRTRTTAANRARTERRSEPNVSISSGLTSTPRLELVSGYAASSRFEIVASSSRAVSAVWPGRRRPTACKPRLPRSVKAAPLEAKGIRISAWSLKPANPGGRIPMTVRGRPSRDNERPTRVGSPPKRRCQRPCPTSTTASPVPGVSSSARMSRPTSGSTPSV